MGHQFTFYLDPADIQGDRIRFSRGESHHLSDVLRLQKGDIVEATDGQGRIYSVRLDRIEDGCWTGLILSRQEHELRAPLPIVLALPCIKGERWQMALEAACEIGVREIRLVDYHQAAVKWTATRREKAQRKALEILKQSGGSRLTEIGEPASFRQVLERNAFKEIWVADPDGDPLSDVSPDALLVIGPEAGFHTEEEALLRQYDARRFCLASRRLRSEVAAVVALSQFALMLKS